MANYPSFGQIIGSSETREDRVVFDRATNGTLRGRAMWTSAKKQFSVEHILKSSDVATMRTFYDTNRALAVSFTWKGDGSVYWCLFERPPVYTPLGAGWWRVRVQLVQA